MTPATCRDKCAGGGCRSETTYENHSSSDRVRRDGLVAHDVHAQRRSGGVATLAIFVTDPAGNGIGDVKVTAQGPVNKDARTERGRIVFEDVPAGTYRLRFDREGFISLERELVARPARQWT